LVEEGDAAIAQTVDAFGKLIAEVATGQDGAGFLGKLGFVERVGVSFVGKN
jgi:hypothetical protein